MLYETKNWMIGIPFTLLNAVLF